MPDSAPKYYSNSNYLGWGIRGILAYQADREALPDISTAGLTPGEYNPGL